MKKRETFRWCLVKYLLILTGFILLFNPGPAHSAPGDLLWSFELTGEIKATPTIKGSMVIIGDMKGKLFARALDDGASIWEISLTAPIRSSVTPFQDRLYVGAGDGLYCLETVNGNTLWHAATPDAIGSTPVYYKGKVYVGCDDGKLYCFDADNGEEIWSYPTGGQIDSSPALYQNRVLFGSRDDNFYCLDSETAELKWTFPTGGDIVSSPCVWDGLVYLASNDHKVYCLKVEDGDKQWEFQTESPSSMDISSSPALADGKLLVASYDKNLYALDVTDVTDGTVSVSWTYPAGYAMSSSPAVSGTRVYIGDNAGVIHCIDLNIGEALWMQSPNYPDSEAFHYCSPVLQQGSLFISGMGTSAGQNGKLYALQACCPASPPWTKFRHDPQNTGCASFVFNYGTESAQIPLISGWNLSGASLNPNIPYVDSLFQDIEDHIASAWKWDSSKSAWQVYLPGEETPGAYAQAKGFSDWDHLYSGTGFWLNIETAGNVLTITGRTTTDTDLNLVKGWNLTALKSNSTIPISKYLGDVEGKIADVTDNVMSAWMWNKNEKKWQVHIPSMTAAKQETYITQKGFKNLTTITGNSGFWLNVGNQNGLILPESPPILVTTDSQGITTLGESNVQLFLAGKIDYQKSPLGGADLLTSEKDGQYTVFMNDPSYTYNSITPGEEKNGYLYVQKVDKKKEEMKTKSGLETGEWNIECEEAPAEIPKPAPKVINSSDGSTTLIITNMVLMSDITVSVTPYKSPLYVPNVNSLKDDLPSISGDIITLGGGDVCMVDSSGNRTDSVKAGFCASVFANTSSFFKTMSPEDAKQLVDDKKANIYLLYFRDGHWHKLGSARLEKIKENTYCLMPASSVYMNRLYSFLFVLVPAEPPALAGTISGKVYAEGSTDGLAGAQVALKDGEGYAVTNTDGSFSLAYSLPGEAGETAVLFITAQKPGYEDTVIKVDVSVDAPSPAGVKITLDPLPATFSLTGKVTDADTDATLKDAVIYVYTPAVLNEITISADGQTITAGYSGTATYTWEVLDSEGNSIKTIPESKKYTLSISELTDVLTTGATYELHVSVSHTKGDKTFIEEQTGFILPEGESGFKFEMMPKSSLPSTILGKSDNEGNYEITGLSLELDGFLTARAGKNDYYLFDLYSIASGQTTLNFALTPQVPVEDYFENFEEPPGWESSGVSEAVKWHWLDSPDSIKVCPDLTASILYADFPTLDAEGTITDITEAGAATITINVPSLDLPLSLTRTLMDTDGNGTYDHIMQDWSSYDKAKYLVYVAGDDPNLLKGDSVMVAYPDPVGTLSLLPAYSGSHVFWYGNLDTGTYSDVCTNTSSSENSGTLKSPVIDLSAFAYATLGFNTWYEVESVDIAKEQYDKMLIYFSVEDDDKTKDDIVNLIWKNKIIPVYAHTKYHLDSLNPDMEPPNLQKKFVPYAPAGVAAAPVWVSREYNLDPLIGHKVRLYFDFETADKNYNGFRGWAIDDVKIANTGSDLEFGPISAATGLGKQGLLKSRENLTILK